MIAHEADHLVASLLQLGNEIREDPMHADDHGAVAAFEAGVLRGITGMPAPRQRRRRRIARHVATVAAAAVLAIVPGPRTAIAHWFGIGRVRIERDTTREVTGLPSSVLDLDLGTPSTLAHAQARLGRTVATISGHVPAGVWIQPFGPAGSDSVIVNSVYATGPLKDVFGAAGGRTTPSSSASSRARATCTSTRSCSVRAPRWSSSRSGARERCGSAATRMRC